MHLNYLFHDIIFLWCRTFAMPVAESFLQVRFWAPLTDAILKKKRCSQMSPAFAFVFRVPTWDLVFWIVRVDVPPTHQFKS